MDGFPFLREHWIAIEEEENIRCKPDVIVVLVDNSKDSTGLLNRWKDTFPEDTQLMMKIAAEQAAGESTQQEGQSDPPQKPVNKMQQRWQQSNK